MSKPIMDRHPDDSNRVTLVDRLVNRLADAWLELQIKLAYANFLLASGPCETRRYLDEWVSLCACRSPAQLARMQRKEVAR